MRARSWTARIWMAVLGVGLLAGEAGAQDPRLLAPRAERTIRVTGYGEVQARPDLAQLSLAVESFAPTARAAGQENARAMERVIQALVAAGVPRGEIETRNYSVYPEYVHDREGNEPRLRGYRATNQVVVETPRLERVGELIDLALGAGANRVEGVAFRLRDPEAVRTEALREAVVRARASAEAIAGALGVGLGDVLDASTTAESARPVPIMARMDIAEAAGGPPPPTPIEPGEQTIRAHVSLIFAVTPP